MNPSVQSYVRIAITSVWLASGAAAATGCAQRTPQPAVSADATSTRQSDEEATSAIGEAIRRYEAALNRSALDEVLGLYGSDPVFMPQHAPALVGHDAVRAGYEQVFATIKLDIRFEVHEVQRAGDWAWARTSSAGRTRILADGTEVAEGNNELFVFRREDGVWKIHRYLFSTNRPRR